MNVWGYLKLLFPRRYRTVSPHLRSGKIGEDAAARYLWRHGYAIVERNFVSGKNEIDIIARKKKTYIFCEVKSRILDYGEDLPFGRPADAVTEDKKRHLIAAATTFERRHRRDGYAYRFDVLEVYLTKKNGISHICHMKNAFMREPYHRRLY